MSLVCSRNRRFCNHRGNLRCSAHSDSQGVSPPVDGNSHAVLWSSGLVYLSQADSGSLTAELILTFCGHGSYLGRANESGFDLRIGCSREVDCLMAHLLVVAKAPHPMGSVLLNAK